MPKARDSGRRRPRGQSEFGCIASPGLSDPAKDRPSRVLKFGTLGAARIAPAGLLAPAAGMASVEVACVAARDRRRAEIFAGEHGIAQVLEDYAHVVAAPVDAIYVPLPPSEHAEWTIRALEAGKHVLCEKPFALCAEEARRMVATAEACDRILMEAFHSRYHPLFARMLEYVESGVLGPILSLEAEFTVAVDAPENFRRQRALGGGATMDLGCYPIHWLRTLMGHEPEVVSAAARADDDGVDESMTARLAFSNGVEARVHSSMAADVPRSARIQIRGRDGKLDVSNPLAPQFGNEIRLEQGRDVRTETVEAQTSYAHQLEAFADVIDGNSDRLLTGGEDAVANMKVIDAVYAAAGLPSRGPEDFNSEAAGRGD